MSDLSNLFAYPTTNSWEENVFQLTIPGIIAVIAVIGVLIALALFFYKKDTGSTQKAVLTKQLTFSGAAMALGLITSELLPTFRLPMGGSATLFSMLFIVLIGYLFGLKAGITSALAYGMLQFVIDPVFYSIPQMIVDYPLAFGALGLAGIFATKKHGLIWGYITGVIGRYIFAVISGVIFFAHYAPEGTPALVYSLGYNATYLVPEAVITLVLLALPPVSKGIGQVKKMVAAV